MSINRYYKIGIDCRFWGIIHTGLGRYTKELILAIIKVLEKENWKINNSLVSLTLFFQKENWQNDIYLSNKCKIIKIEAPHYSLKEQLKFGRIIDQEKLDLVHFTHFNVPFFLKTPFVVTIHDLIKHFFRGQSVTTRFLPIYWLKYWGYRIVIDKAIKKSKYIFTPSKFVANQLKDYYSTSTAKIRVTYEGVADVYKNNNRTATGADEVLNRYQLKRPFFIYTGNAYSFKNLTTLLKAIKAINHKTQKITLLIACGRSIFWERLSRQVKEYNLEKMVVLPGLVSDNDLRILYRQAVAFVNPSLMEGFGLPGLEAMASGCPVIAAKAGSLPEIYAEGAIFFEAQNILELAQKIMETLHLSPAGRKRLIDNGIKQAQKYSWEKTARETILVYKKILMKN
ncbi:hypothetical protein A2160_02310 [Candidatus Beckwithbacteria bacterium RBG_13_42_9]|uniref:Glycosyl transferase family 1 domain-containing protein n=1 Tax=Candidatus Beckwithbacteria bacterium RBG_13_42_9 TaxID=1797457 RepID=A0A1F5E7G6_9BACT|nr:MAG: hypothetical protein A2160_02310 [Candidatus Beckwithbacteria bacterium RBG_13_42_9]